MPYAKNSELPSSVKDALPTEAQSVFRRVFNQQLKDGKTEERGFQVAWTAVKNGWKKDGDKWIKKGLDTVNKKVYNSSDFEIIRKDDSQRMVYGWANQITKSGESVQDLQGDIIEPEELVKFTTEYMKTARVSKLMHRGGQIGQVVHSFPLTYEIAKSLGLTTDTEGWLVGVYIANDDVWQAVQDGKLTSFSIGGTGTRIDAEDS